MSKLAAISKHHLSPNLGPASYYIYLNYSMSWWFCWYSTLVCVLFDDWFVSFFTVSGEAVRLKPSHKRSSESGT